MLKYKWDLYIENLWTNHMAYVCIRSQAHIGLTAIFQKTLG